MAPGGSIKELVRFSIDVVRLPSFPLFLGYCALVFMARPYQRYTKPMELSTAMVVYNYLCSSLSLYTFLAFIYGIFDAPSLYAHESTTILQHVYAVYFGVKVLELLDTVFMMLRHKTRQISFLHVFHHSSMLILTDYGRMRSAWPAIAPVLALNSFVHILLYYYYAQTVNSPARPTWKRRITEVQIGQFLIDLVYATNGYLSHNFCVWSIFYGLAMTALFMNFYVRAYVLRGKKLV